MFILNDERILKQKSLATHHRYAYLLQISTLKGNNFSFCNSRFLRVANSSNQPIQMKSTVTYTSIYTVLARKKYVFNGWG